MPFERYEILLPFKYNDGTPVEPEKFQATRRELVAQFGALTMDAPPVSGLWVSGGHEYQDELIRFVVDAEATPATDEFSRDFKERLKERFCALTRSAPAQEAVAPQRPLLRRTRG